MIRRRLASRSPFAIELARTFVLVAASVSCGGSGGGARTPDGGGLPGGGAFTWKDGGTLHTALFASGARVTSTSLDMVQITGSDAGAGLSFSVSLMPPPLVTGAYACSDNAAATGRIVSIAYTVGSNSGLVPTCAITLDTLGATSGAHATGTFSATVPFSDGTTRTITDGAFDVPVTLSSL